MTWSRTSIPQKERNESSKWSQFCDEGLLVASLVPPEILVEPSIISLHCWISERHGAMWYASSSKLLKEYNKNLRPWRLRFLWGRVACRGWSSSACSSEIAFVYSNIPSASSAKNTWTAMQLSNNTMEGLPTIPKIQEKIQFEFFPHFSAHSRKKIVKWGIFLIENQLSMHDVFVKENFLFDFVAAQCERIFEHDDLPWRHKVHHHRRRRCLRDSRGGTSPPCPPWSPAPSDARHSESPTQCYGLAFALPCKKTKI